MVLSKEPEIDLEEKYSNLCNNLNLKYGVKEDSWDHFIMINKNFTLEGDPVHWLGCAIYATAWTSVNLIQNNGQGNCVSLTRLLAGSNLSIAEFFHKIRHWLNMANMPDDFRKRIDLLEKGFTAVYNVFNNYQEFFLKIFNRPEVAELELIKQRNRKQKPLPCTPLRVFEFCWTLFLTIKSEETSRNNEFVSYCHLLMAICDWAFKNALIDNRKDLLNSNFKGLPEDWSHSNYVMPTTTDFDTICILDLLCPSEHTLLDVKYVKEYQFKQSLKTLFDKGALRGKEDFLDIFDTSVFDQNMKNISNIYERSHLTKSDFDERIFIAEYKRQLILKEEQNQNSDEQLGTISNEMGVNQCLTPLSGRKYLGPKEDERCVMTATENLQRLQNLIHGRISGASEALKQIFTNCSKDPTERIDNIVTTLSNRFINAFQMEHRETAKKRLQMAITLFYKFVETLLQNECSLQSDISVIVEKDVFYECMFGCSLEIVIYSYNHHRQKFPWILEALQVQSYNFVKVIELIIRSKDKLARDSIKHLNMVEETILSSLLWKADSLIWDAIVSSDEEVPKFEETALPGHLQNETNSNNSDLKASSDTNRHLLSPGISATDRFQSPLAQSNNKETNQQLLQHAHLMIKDRDGNTRMIPIVNNDIQKVQQPRLESGNIVKPKRTGGVSIIFRKFYNLSGERMEHLCTHLKITNIDTKRKIWTVFEEIVRKNNCELMRNRNLDQLLMCAVYMICKLTNVDKSFAEIIRSYRIQPQATSDIYRMVLIQDKKTQIMDGMTVEIPEERGDLINFYNNVIIKAMNKFVQRFVNKNIDEPNCDVLLSPLPAARGQVVQVLDNIFIKPLESPTMPFNHGKVLNYYFSRSPSKDLKDINKAIKGNGVIGKRLLIDGDKEMPIGKRKVQSLIEERRNQNTE